MPEDVKPRRPYRSELRREQAEETIRAMGFRVLRVRHHGEIARIR